MGNGRFGNIIQQPNKKWKARYTIPGQSKQCSKTFSRKGDAAAWLAQEQTLILSGEWTPPRERVKRVQESYREQTVESCTVTDFFPQFINYSVHVRKISPNTLADYHSMFNVWIFPSFGEVSISEITSIDTERWYYQMLESLKESTARDRYDLFKRYLDRAVKSGIISENPCTLEFPRRSEHRSDASHVASPEEVKKIINLMPEDLRLAVLLATWCAMRMGEILALQRDSFSNLSSENPVVIVDKQVISKTGELGSPKCGEPRIVSIPTVLVPEIKGHLARFVGPSDDSFLFHGRKNSSKRLHHNSLRTAFKTACSQVPNLKNLRFHDLRHTGLTLYAQQGATLKEIAERGGHRDIKVALMYQHATRERDSEVANRLNNLIDLT